MKRVILIFSGYNQRAIISFLRTLEDNNISNYYIIAASQQDTILRTSYRKNVFYIRKSKELRLNEICHVLDKIRELGEAKKILIIPSTEALNRFALKYRKIFEEHNAVIPLVNEALYSRISDKSKFCELCNYYNFLVPKQIEEIEHFQHSLVAKPKTYVSSVGITFSPVIIQSEEELRLFREEYPIQDFIFQEFICGKSYYLLYYFTKDGQVHCLSQWNLIQQSGGKSIVAACLSRMHEKNLIAKQYQEMFKDIGFFGFVMVELRYTGKDFYMIEANPRFWGPSQLFCNSGYNFFEIFLQEYGYMNEIPCRTIDYDAKYLWSGEVEGALLENTNCIWLEGGKDFVQRHYEEFLASEIYNREDTIEIYNLESMKYG